MEKFYLGRVIVGPTSWTGEPIVQITKDEKDKIYSCINFVSFYFTCSRIHRIVCESGRDYIDYCQKLEKTTRVYSEKEMFELLTTSNKLLISYLSFLKIFIDVTSNAIAKKRKSNLNTFQEYNRKQYDSVFGYRFLSRLRNYVIHYEMPLTSIKSDTSGVKIWCNRSHLLKFNGWSTVKDEIAKLPENIEVTQFIKDSNCVVDSLYYWALETILEDVSAGSLYLRRKCEKYNINMLAIGKMYDSEDKTTQITWSKLPLEIFKEYVEDISHDPNIMIDYDQAECDNP